MLASIAAVIAPAEASPRKAASPLLHAAGRYFATPDGKPVFLAGSHTWNDLQTLTVGAGRTDTSAAVGAWTLDFTQFCAWMASNDLNFVRMWTDCSYPPQNRSVSPQPWVVSDGKYDLTAFDPAYFDRVLSCARTAAARGIYLSFMLFCAGSYIDPRAWRDYSPFYAGNNSNGVSGDPNGTGNGLSCLEGTIPAIVDIQTAYIRKMCDTLAGQTNVLFEICNEAPGSHAVWSWQESMMNTLRRYAARRRYPAWPVGLTAAYPPATTGKALNDFLFGTTADWVSPSGFGGEYQETSPQAPANKVVIVDTDHILRDPPDAGWVWRQFMEGYGGILLMDDLDGLGIRGGGWQNSGIGPREAQARLSFAQVRRVSERVDLAGIVPSPSLSSTGYCLANPSAGEYIALADRGDTIVMNLSGSGDRFLQAEWLDLGSGRTSDTSAISGTSGRQEFTSPYGAGVLIVSSGQSRRGAGH